MTTEIDDYIKNSPNYQLGRIGQRIIEIHERLLAVREELHMGNNKDALAKLNETIKYIYDPDSHLDN